MSLEAIPTPFIQGVIALPTDTNPFAGGSVDAIMWQRGREYGAHKAANPTTPVQERIGEVPPQFAEALKAAQDAEKHLEETIQAAQNGQTPPATPA